MAGGRWSRSYEQRYLAARARGEPSPFADPAHAGGPTPPGGGPPGSDRDSPGPAPVPEPSPARLDRPGGRPCWVAGPPSSPGPHPGLLLTWRREHEGWFGRVAYVVLDPDSRPLLIDTWVPADALRPSSPPR